MGGAFELVLFGFLLLCIGAVDLQLQGLRS